MGLRRLWCLFDKGWKASCPVIPQGWSQRSAPHWPLGWRVKKVIMIIDDKLLVSLKLMPPSSSPNVHQCLLQSLHRFLSCSHQQTCSCSTLWLTSGHRERGSDWKKKRNVWALVRAYETHWQAFGFFHRVQAAWKLTHTYGLNPQLISSPSEDGSASTSPLRKSIMTWPFSYQASDGLAFT